MKYIIATLGCKVNQYESEAMEQLLQSHGHTPCAEGESADAVIVNTCAVTAEGARKARQTVRRLRRENPDALTALCGCWSQVDAAEAASLGADVLFGTGDRQGFVRAVETAAAERGAGGSVTKLDDPFRRTGFEELPAGSYAGRRARISKFRTGATISAPTASFRSRAGACSPCRRTGARRRPRRSPRRAIRRSSSPASRSPRGARISKTAKRSSMRSRPSLRARVARIHLGSLEPTVVTDSFVERLKKLNVCPHFHLSMQSGCDETLARMRRKYTTAEFFAVTERLRAAFPGCALTTDLITGFPGETEEEFSRTLAFIEKMRLRTDARVPVFRPPRHEGGGYARPDRKRAKRPRAREPRILRSGCGGNISRPASAKRSKLFLKRSRTARAAATPKTIPRSPCRATCRTAL